MKPIQYLLLAVLLALTGCASTMQRGALSLAYKAMQKELYDRALNDLSRAEKYRQASPEMAAEISFLRAQCYDRSGRQSEAMGAYRYTRDSFRETTYAYQAETRLKELEKQAAVP